MSLSLIARRLFSSSVTAARRAKGSHIHRMDGYSLLEEATKTGSAVSSGTFLVGGRKWELDLYPNGIHDGHRGFVSAELRLAYGHDDKDKEEATATYSVSILDQDGNPRHVHIVGPCRFQSPSERRYGYGFGSDYYRQRYLELTRTTKDDDEEEEKMKKTSVDKLVAAEELRRSAPFLLPDDRLSVQCDVSVVETDSARPDNHNNNNNDTKWFMGLFKG